MERDSGSHAIQLETVDTVGNRTTVDFPLFVREYDPPVSCTLAVVADPSNWARVRMSVSTRDTGSSIGSIAYFVDGQVWDSDLGLVVAPGAPYTNTRETPALTEGNHVFAVDCVDQQHNIAVSGTHTLYLAPPCDTTVVADDKNPSTRTFNMGKSSGTVLFTYQTFDVHDRMRVFTPSNQVLLDTGCTATGDSANVPSRTLTYSGTSRLTVVVDPNCNPATSAPSTLWNYRLACPP